MCERVNKRRYLHHIRKPSAWWHTFHITVNVHVSIVQRVYSTVASLWHSAERHIVGSMCCSTKVGQQPTGLQPWALRTPLLLCPLLLHKCGGNAIKGGRCIGSPSISSVDMTWSILSVLCSCKVNTRLPWLPTVCEWKSIWLFFSTFNDKRQYYGHIFISQSDSISMGDL